MRLAVVAVDLAANGGSLTLRSVVMQGMVGVRLHIGTSKGVHNQGATPEQLVSEARAVGHYLSRIGGQLVAHPDTTRWDLRLFVPILEPDSAG